MNNRSIKIEFFSPLRDMMAKFIQEKQGCGYKYEREVHALKRFDKYLCEIGPNTKVLSKSIVNSWTEKRDYEQSGTQNLRIITIRQFAYFLKRQGLDAYICETSKTVKNDQNFTPYIFRRDEVKKILLETDHFSLDNRAPKRHVIMPEIFRLLYCCGMRVSEVLHLKLSDVNLLDGILTVYNTKFDKDRFVPMAPSMTERLRKYSVFISKDKPDGFFFPAPDGGSYSTVTIYAIFRQLLRKCGISHGGRGKGPRLHDLRHSFAVHQLENWYKQGVNLEAKLPVLATYLGHRSLIGTQRYLHLTPDIFPDIIAKLQKSVGNIIPGGQIHETN